MTAFKNLGLQDYLLQGIEALGFENPTPVQELVIPVALQSDDDIIALAQTSTGKTAALGLPLLQRITPGQHGIQALVLCLTRELCVQVARAVVRVGGRGVVHGRAARECPRHRYWQASRDYWGFERTCE
jgi:ATP-dependent RNA helicase DeaD